MDNYAILQHYSKTDLRRLAKGKISEIVGLDANKILLDLGRVLGNYESIKRHVEFRTPPADVILEVLQHSDGHCIRVEDLKAAVKARINFYRMQSKELDLQNAAKGYRLYATMLAAAWDYEGDFLPSEANLLRVLRGELGISRLTHQLILAHKEVERLVFQEATYEQELTFLSNEGIILVYIEDGESYFVLSDETAESLLQLWGFEMEQRQYERLLALLNNAQLSRSLKSARLRTSGSNAELVARIVDNEVAPSELLDSLSSQELGALLAKLEMQRGGNKEERILRIIDHFKADRDVAVAAEAEVEVEVVPEQEILPEEALADLLTQFDLSQLSSILGSLDLPKSGTKPLKIDRLVQSPFNVETMLQSLVLEDLRGFAGRCNLRRTGTKSEIIRSIIGCFVENEAGESTLSAKDLLSIYVEISEQDRRAYPPEADLGDRSTTRIGLDFERATRHIFKNMLRLDTKAQRIGREEPDGTLTDDDDSFYCYECKTVLAPPYSLPIQHRLQIRNYISTIAASRRAERFGGYLIIAHSFVDNIEQKIAEIKPTMDIPIGAISAQDLLAFARKWQEGHPIDTFPIAQSMKNGLITARDLNRAAGGY